MEKKKSKQSRELDKDAQTRSPNTDLNCSLFNRSNFILS